ncbi:uncharacterized protein LOC122079325 isoform X2 [Macadamia integrifolia]|uniref:uncharacterized protein LOC122079325 isoform X2 n=1 Tax=Macadamia integrifolia TaxID=60698 RepID=UPI001C4ECF9F|nr:uncharacterized protein LOC122079325 isoform X2 [Macadamia integrifolia]
MEVRDSNKRRKWDEFPSLSTRKRRRIVVLKAGFFYLKSIHGVPLLSSTTASPCQSICLRSDRIYTIGRQRQSCEIVFQDPRISRRHCQIFFDASARKIFILDGCFSPSTSSTLDPDEVRRRFRFVLEGKRAPDCFTVAASSNGVFVNGLRLSQGSVMEVSVGDEVSLACGNQFDSSFRIKIGFVLERVISTEEDIGCRGLFGGSKTIVRLGSSEGRECIGGGSVNVVNSRTITVSRDYPLHGSGHQDVIGRAVSLLDHCRQILRSVDPINYIRECTFSNTAKEDCTENKVPSSQPDDMLDIPLPTKPVLLHNCTAATSSERQPLPLRTLAGAAEAAGNLVNGDTRNTEELEDTRVSAKKTISTSNQNGLSSNPLGEAHQADSGSHTKKHRSIKSSGKTFYLNRLEFMNHSTPDQRTVVSLPELLHPIESLSRIFIATFTTDVSWFLSYCEVPNHLPVTIACHNSERCWDSSPDKRTSIPHSDFPNVMLVYPQFPEVIAFGKQRKAQGVACHHPKLFVLQREDSIRVIVTSANLVSRQWNNVTNTVWWQDFPRQTEPDYSSLFTQPSDGEAVLDSKSDFSSHLAGFMASLVADVPSQAHWIIELTKYDFGGAAGHLVASVPGLHIQKTPYPLEYMHFLSAHQCMMQSTGIRFLGSVEASVVGLSHRFHTAADSSGVQLKTLATFLGKCQENAYAMTEVILKRNTNIPADANAVSVLVCNLDEFSEGDYIQLGFLPRDIAKWVAPLCDIGFFRFSACIFPTEALAAALEGINSKVRLILYVSQGPKFAEISRILQAEHVPAICSLVASIHRCVGLWRLQEVLSRHKWPESLETDFIYGSSSIGTSVNANFLAAFSAAAGKRFSHFSESEESDPEWGRWNASQELKSPSMKIIFPTIESVKDTSSGIWPARHVLCLSETWQRLRTVDIFHNAVPYPHDRVGYPMHVKVARRRFMSKTDSSSFGWVYCGSHNFSPAAWGRPLSYSSCPKADGAVGTNSAQHSKLHLCNYELGIIFTIPPSDRSMNLDDIALPFVIPAPKYGPRDQPATAQAMKEALFELAEKKKHMEGAMMEDVMTDEEFLDEEEEEIVETKDYVDEEREEENTYAETLWSQVDSLDN